jgi:hypothetical protein
VLTIQALHQIQIGSHCSDFPAHEVDLLLDVFIPLCQQTLYSKNSHVGRAGEAAMLYLVQIDPLHTTSPLIDFTCRALDIVSIHQSKSSSTGGYIRTDTFDMSSPYLTISTTKHITLNIGWD